MPLTFDIAPGDGPIALCDEAIDSMIEVAAGSELDGNEWGFSFCLSRESDCISPGTWCSGDSCRALIVGCSGRSVSVGTFHTHLGNVPDTPSSGDLIDIVRKRHRFACRSGLGGSQIRCDSFKYPTNKEAEAEMEEVLRRALSLWWTKLYPYYEVWGRTGVMPRGEVGRKAYTIDIEISEMLSPYITETRSFYPKELATMRRRP